jgi:hypothetical protein
MKLFTSGRYAAVASTLALAVALGGTSYAAVKITGASIQNNTVTTKDIKDKTLKVKDLSPGAKSKLKGATGPAGANGANGANGAPGQPGATGAQGPIGPSNAYGAWNDNPTTLTAAYKTVLSVPVQPGSYVAYSKVFGHRTAPGLAYVYCKLAFGAAAFDITGADEPDIASAYSNVNNQIVFNAPAAGNVTLECLGFQSYIDWKKVTVIKVGSVTNTPGANVAKPAQEPQAR